ncbi:Telomerase activating protein Est1 [Rhizoctonia solani]|uniref:Telomerase activating protein Est1 n=1 Tax=Rhizoctonia solani TaxID=456999 RepID=A0A8H7M4S0_9AGAM|nr:Telomerase activating protein Est1 [Rhizoctonia solani]
MGDPSKLSRDVKGLVADFRGELKLRDPWDREIDIQFKRIQRKYKDILFGFPFARQAQAVDQSLWSDTSYALIAQYRARIDPIRASPPGNKNAVENRKMLQKFLAFLGAEGTFWSGIVSRLVRIHGLTEANGAMVALGMNIVEFENRESLARQGQIDMAPAALEDNPTPTHPPPSHEHRSNKLLVNSMGTHPNKANSEPSTKRSRGGRRGKGGGAEKLNEKPFSKAEAFYVQARPKRCFRWHQLNAGNPFNQLAIVHSYQHDFFGAALNYYRALCVRKPFPTAQDNLIRSLAKCLEVDREMWRERREQEASGDDSGKGKGKAEPAGKPSADNDASKDLESRFKQDVVLLHALWAGKCRPTKLARHTQNVLASFASLVTRRLLPAATIVQVLVITLGALWRVRMFRMEGDHKPERRRAKPKASDREESREEDIHWRHEEIQDGVKEVGEMAGDEQQQAEKLAQRITGTFRRTLPALRIANKWVKANVRYLQQYPLDDSQEPNTPTSPTLPNTMRPSLTSFWHAWSRFDGQLNEAFPLNLLPSVSVNLEEDIDMKGFSPLKWESNGGLDPVGRGVKGCPLASGSIPSETHNQSQGYAGIEPHDRWDEANDTDLGSDDGTPEDDDFPGQEDDRATVSTRTDDDPVRLAMDARLSDHEDEGEDEQILYPQGFRQRPVSVSMSPPPHSASPLLETGPALVWPPPTPSFLSEPTERSARVHSHTQPRPAGTTAEDLLNRVLNGTPTFLNMATSPVGNNTSSIITSNTPFVGRSISMHGPTPSFLSPAQNRSPDPFPLQNPLGAPGLDLRPGLPRSPPQPSAFSNQRSTTFSAVGSPSSLSPGVGRTNDPLAFRSHARLPSLTGAATIWTPAPQEVARAGSWGGPSGTGPMRSNSIAGMVGPGFASDGTWSARNQGFGDMEVNRLSRQQTYATARDIPNWE